jgi:hypothetical protein
MRSIICAAVSRWRVVLAAFGIFVAGSICGVVMSLPSNPLLSIEKPNAGLLFRDWKPCLESAAMRYADAGIEVGGYAAAHACMHEKAVDIRRMNGGDLTDIEQKIAAFYLAKDAVILMKRRWQRDVETADQVIKLWPDHY